MMSKITAKELVAFAKSKIGVPYVYGMKGEVMTWQKYNQLKSMYGKMVWKSDKKKIGKVCCDCSGLISWATGIVRSSQGYYDTAVKIQSIATIAQAPIGAAVWRKGHIGIYIGNGQYIAEDGSAYGCRKNSLKKAKFTHWLLLKDIDYTEQTEQEEEDVTKYYETIQQVPTWAKKMVQKQIDKGCYADEKALHLSDDMLRTMAILQREND